jgi:hypothetical protein
MGILKIIITYVAVIGFSSFWSNSGDTVEVLRKGHIITVNLNAVQAHFNHGDSPVVQNDIPDGATP